MIPRDELLRIRRIASRANPRIKDWSGLGERKERLRLGLTMAEGVTLAGEALNGPANDRLRPAIFLVSDSGAEREEAGRLFALAGERGLERFSLSDDCFAKISTLKNTEGVAILLAFDVQPAAFAPVLIAGDARWLIAAGVQDPGNAGALARTALAAGCGGCLFLDGADPFSPKFLRGSMGAAFRLPCLSGNADDFIATWQASSVRLVLADSAGGEDFRQAEYASPLALLVGGERGVPPPLAALADCRVHIPLHGGVESLNLAVAAGIILFAAGK